MAYKYTSTLIVKYGGGAMVGSPPRGSDPILEEIAGLWRSGHAVVLVHGGGPEIDRALARRGIATQRVDGMRVTDEETLEATEAVLCGTVNKRIVRQCLALDLPAVGVSGEDGGTLIADRALGPNHADLGYVGAVATVNTRLLQALLDAGFLPVVAPLAVARDASHPYNVNADIAASAIAVALGVDAFVAITNVPRVLRELDDPSSGIERLTPDEAFRLAASDGCSSSMKPKVAAAATAARDGVGASYICLAKPSAIAGALKGDATIVCASFPSGCP